MEPNARMVRLARRQLPLGFPVEFLDLPGERIPLADACVDTVSPTSAGGSSAGNLLIAPSSPAKTDVSPQGRDPTRLKRALL